MFYQIISLALISSPVALNSGALKGQKKVSIPSTVSLRSSMRKMGYFLANPPLLEIPKIPESAIAQFPCFGILRQNADGFIYVDVDDDYIHELIHFIEDDGWQEPPYFGSDPEFAGAHISVVYAREGIKGEIEEIGQVVYFTPLECKIVSPSQMIGIEGVYLIEVESPELSLIRSKYGLPKNEFGFHITVGVKPHLNDTSSIRL